MMITKYYVIKAKDVHLKLTDDEKKCLSDILKKLNNQNEYWVVNRDEWYADKVESLIFHETCSICKGPIKIRNPTGHCDHLYYPEYLEKD